MTQTRLENTLAMTDALCDDVPATSGPPVRASLCVEVGDALATGRCGIRPDPVRAKRYFDRACARGYQPACNALARWRSE